MNLRKDCYYPVDLDKYPYIDDINQLPETLSEKAMWLPYIANTLYGRTVSINGITFRMSENITTQDLHAKYKRPEKIDIFAGVHQVWKIHSTGKKQEVYNVEQNGRNFTCSCKGFLFRKGCKHVDEVKKRLNIK